jgi:hypothetical protein
MIRSSDLARAVLFAIVTFAVLVCLGGPAAAQLSAGSPWPMSQHDVRHTGQSSFLGPLFPSGAPDPTVDVRIWQGFDKIKMSPIIGADGVIYVGLGFSFCAINPWPNMTTDWCVRLRADVSSTAAAQDKDGIVYVGDRDNSITAFNPTLCKGLPFNAMPAVTEAAGCIKWRYNHGTEGDIWTSPAIVADGTIYFVHTGSLSGSGVVTALTPPPLNAPPMTPPKVKWKYVLGVYAGNSSPAIDSRGYIYLADTVGYLHCFQDLGDQDLPGGGVVRLWKKQIDITNVTGSPVISNDSRTLYIGTSSGLKAVQIDPANTGNPPGTILWTFPTVGKVDQTPALGADGTLYFGSIYGVQKRIYALNPATQLLRWQHGPVNFDSTYSAFPIIGGDGTVYVGFNRGIYAFAPDGNGAPLWKYDTTHMVISYPVLSGTATAGSGGRAVVYIGSQDHKVYAVSSVRGGGPTEGDFNGDSRADIFWRGASGELDLWLMNGSVVNNVVGLGPVDTAWTIVATGDFNGDGNADLVWRNTAGSVVVWLMDGSTLLGAGWLTGATDWVVTAAGDLDGDGKTDLLWRHPTGSVVVWLMNGLTSTGAAWLIGATDWTIGAVGDLNGDGKADVLWRHASGASVVWLMNGLVMSNAGWLPALAAAWSPRVADFDGDGKADILWRQAAGGVTLWLMDGAVVRASAPLQGAAANWSLAKIADFDGDGNADILWRQPSGNLTMWLMDGFTIAPAAVGNVPSTWTAH